MLDLKTLSVLTLDKAEIRSVYGDLKDKFEESLEIEKRKYPLSEREQLLADTILNLLSLLDSTHTLFY